MRLLMVVFLTVLVITVIFSIAYTISPSEIEELPGKNATDFTLRDLEGRDISLSDFHGKPVLLNFWATWNIPYRTEMPSMERLHREYKEKGLVILAVSVDRGSPEKIKKFIKELKLTFPILFDPAGKTFRTYKVYAIPTTFLIDKYGIIAYKFIGEKDWASKESKELIDRILIDK